MYWIIGGLTAPLLGFLVGGRVSVRGGVWAGAFVASLVLLGLALAIANNVRAEADWRFGASPEERAAQVAAFIGFPISGFALGGLLSKVRHRAASVAAIAAAALLYAAFGQAWSVLAGCLIFARCGGVAP